MTLMWHTASVVQEKRYEHDPDSDPEYIKRVKTLAVETYKKATYQELLKC